jgi:membrane protein
MTPKGAFNLFKGSGLAWSNDNAARLGAALSYYAIFAIPQILLILLFIASFCMSRATLQLDIHAKLSGLLGNSGAQTVETALKASRAHSAGLIATVLATVSLVLTATGLFIELQGDLNAIWDVEPRPGLGVKRYVKNRFFSFLLVMGMALLMVASLVVSAWLAAAVKYLNAHLHGLGFLSLLANDLLSFGVLTLLFGAMFKVLPDIKVGWRNVWAGAGVTSFLFTVGKVLLGWYLAKNSTVSAYGAAGSVILLLLWIYYSAQIFFFGAELTKVRALQLGTQLKPKSHARWKVHEEHREIPIPRPSAVRPETRAQPDSENGRNHRRVAELRAEVEQLRSVVKGHPREN